MSGARPFIHRGLALVIALIVLTVLSLLALSAMQRASTELLMAGNEQYRLAASAAAGAGIEQGIAQIRQLTTAQAPPAAATSAPTFFGSSGASFRSSIHRRGEASILPGSSAEKFRAIDFEIESSATAPRGATDTQLQGVRLLQSLSGAASPGHRLGAGPATP
jgi:hypothetical protein